THARPRSANRRVLIVQRRGRDRVRLADSGPGGRLARVARLLLLIGLALQVGLVREGLSPRSVRLLRRCKTWGKGWSGGEQGRENCVLHAFIPSGPGVAPAAPRTYGAAHPMTTAPQARPDHNP